jgi:hypothetical protein
MAEKLGSSFSTYVAKQETTSGGTIGGYTKYPTYQKVDPSLNADGTPNPDRVVFGEANDNVSVSMNSVPTYAPSMLSSSAGADIVTQQTQKLNALSSNPAVTTGAETKGATGGANTGVNVDPKSGAKAGDAAAPVTTKVTLINPETEQSVTFDNADKSSIQSYMDNGYQVSEASGSIPSWLQPSGVDQNSDIQKAENAANAAESELRSLQKNLTQFMVSDADLAQQVSGVSAIWDARIEDMRRINSQRKSSINTLGIRLGSRYAGGSGGQFGGIVTEEERQGVVRIGELEGQKQAAIAAAKLAAQQQNWQVYSKMVDQAEKAYEKKLKAVEELNAAAAAQNKAIMEALQEQQKELNKVMTDAAKGGAPKEVISAIDSATTIAEALGIASEYMQEPPAVVQEWKYVNQERAKAGVKPISLESYMDVDANRKRSIVNVNSGGLNPGQTSNYLRITDKFQADPIVMAAEKGKTARLIADQVLADPKNAANQLKSLYVLVKNLDPDSAVREGEVNLAQQTQSYADKFKTSIQRIQNGQVISSKAAIELANATKDLAGAWDTSAKSRTNRYISQANNADPMVGQAFGQYLSDYSELSGSAEFTVQSEQQAEQKVQNLYGTYGDAINSLIQAEPDISYSEILQALGE